MDTRKVLGIIFSILFVGAFTFVLCWGIINFNKLKDSMSSTGVYTEADVNNAYQDGYDTALQDKQSYDELINSYRDTITTQTDQISQLSSQVTSLTNNNKDCINRITTLETQKSSLESQVENLTTIKTDNETLISELNVQVANLQNEVSRLENNGLNSEQEIEQKNAQIVSLQNMVSQLQKTNELNVQTINNLNNQITSLNSQISEMTLQIQNNSSNVSTLNGKIAELEKSVAYYEQYIASLENGEQVVATFEYDGSVYNIQIVNKGSKLSVNTPTSTAYKVFNYWTVNGQQINLNNYTITNNTKIVADVTYKYDVNFKVDNTLYNNQIIEFNHCATLPTNPIKEGYEFDGWSLNGIDIIKDINSIPVTNNITYTAVFTKLHTVNFMVEGNIVKTLSIRNGKYASHFTPVLSNAVFNGWTINGTMVNLDTYKIVADIVFVADLTYPHNVTFMVDNQVYATQVVNDGEFATLVNEDFENILFNGWKVDNNFVDVTTYTITEDTTFVGDFDYYYWKTFNAPNVEFESMYQYYYGLWTDGADLYFTYTPSDWNRNQHTFIYNFQSSSWNEITMVFGDDFSFKPDAVWNNGIDTYYSGGQSSQYKFNKETYTWIEVTWTGYDSGYLEPDYIWTDGTNYYYSWRDAQFLINFDAYTLTPVTFTGVYNLYGSYVWNYNGSTYCSTGDNGGYQYLLDPATRTWTLLSQYEYYSIAGEYVIEFKDRVYCSRYGSIDKFVPDAEVYTWNDISGGKWAGELENFNFYIPKNMVINCNDMYFIYYKGAIVKLVTSVM